jgi:hypothetical protein
LTFLPDVLKAKTSTHTGGMGRLAAREESGDSAEKIYSRNWQEQAATSTIMSTRIL